MTMQIIQAGPADAPLVAGLIARAFHPLAVARWLVPDELLRGRMFPDYFAILVEHAIEHGTVHSTEDREAVAVWLPYVDAPPSPPADYQGRLATLAGAWVERFAVFDALLAEHHPTRPHHYLAFLAVRPDRQGRGLGTMLLNHHHAYLDQAGLPAYLEASSRTSRDLYLRQGYEPHGYPLVLPNGPLMWPALREPGCSPDPGWKVGPARHPADRSRPDRTRPAHRDPRSFTSRVRPSAGAQFWQQDTGP